MFSTKIVCTIGPSSSEPDTLRALIQNGMSVARLNFSHGSRSGHEQKIRAIREASRELGTPVAILQDLSGPKIRVGRLPESGVRLEAGQPFVLTTEAVEGSNATVSVSYDDLPSQVQVGDPILLADGAIELAVTAVDRTRIHCKVITGDLLTSHKGVNLPTRTLQVPALTDKDREDLLFGLKLDVDFVALSFVRRAQDILEAKGLMAGLHKETPLIAKIEKHEAIESIDEIMDAADGIMVARGDLGVEISLEDVPAVQKMLIRKANDLGKPVITATQMLRSMVDSPRPTRAEATDVANAVLDGTDAVMLSEETAVGRNPVKAVEFMARIISSAERHFPHERYLRLIPRKTVPESVAHASCVLADHLDASAIVALTRSGRTAEHVSRFRPRQPIVALSPNEAAGRRLMLFWGCHPRVVPEPKYTDDMIETMAEAAVATTWMSKGDLVVMTAGYPIGVVGSTNMIRVKKL